MADLAEKHTDGDERAGGQDHAGCPEPLELCEGGRLGAHRATLEVRRSNDVARHLYERLGFSTAGVRRAYYTNPVEDALVLWREHLEERERADLATP